MTLFSRLLAAVVILGAQALGGGCLEGSDCSNACPLARSANARVATGHEAVARSAAVRADLVAAVLENLEAI